MKNLNWPFLIVLAFTFFEIGNITAGIGKEIPMHYYTISLPATSLLLLTGLFLFGYYAAKAEEFHADIPTWRTNLEKLKDKTTMFWCTLAGILAFTIQLVFEIGEKAPARTYSWEVPIMAFVINAWMFGLGYVSRLKEYKNILQKY